MNIIIRIFKEIFDFFCGDWRVFWGVTVTIVLVESVEHLAALFYARPAVGIIFIIGVSLSLVFALKREIT
jgi:hypothetical protein